MRKLVFYIAFTFFALVVVNQLTAQSNSSNPYDKIGQIHNEGLEYVFKYLKNQKKKGLLKTKKDVLKYAEKATINFIKENKHFNDENIKSAIIEIRKAFKHIDNSSKIWPASANDLLSDTQKNYLLQLESIIKKIGNKKIDDAKAKILKLESTIKSKVEKKEQGILLIACSVARHSLQYWHDNINNWIMLFSDSQQNSNTLAFNWPDVVKDDIAGAVGGGVVGAVVGGSVSLGALTLPGWAVGAVSGAVGNSVANGVRQLLDSIW